MFRRPTMLLAALTILALLLAVPVLAGGKDTAPGQQKDKQPSTPITISGTVEKGPDADGETSYTLRDGGTTYTLEAGPKWFFGDAYPLEPYVGQSVTIDGEVAEGSTEVDVRAVNGTAIREPGKPSWAGGWKVVGEAHPGWSQDKADRFADKFGDCWPPGHCMDKPDHGGQGGPGADDETDEVPEAE
jgi:hypothetical protein